MHNHPQLASEYAGKLKDRINTKSERDVFSESTKEIALDSIKNNSSDIELVTDIHLYKLLEKEKIRV